MQLLNDLPTWWSVYAPRSSVYLLFLVRAGLVGVAIRYSIDCSISLKTLLVAAASSRRCATKAVSDSIDS